MNTYCICISFCRAWCHRCAQATAARDTIATYSAPRKISGG